jgi:hypothetical protein
MMVDWSTVLVTLLSVAVGAILTYIGAVLLDQRANRKKVAGLRKLLHGDILRMSHDLSSLQDEIIRGLSNEKLNLDDAETANWLFDVYRLNLKVVLSNEWHQTARAEPYIFSQLPSSEQAAFEELYGLQLAVQEMSDKFLKRPDPRNQISAQEEDLERVLRLMETTIKDKLNEELMVEMSTELDNWYVAWIFHREKVTQGLPQDATSEQIIESAKSVAKELYHNKLEKEPKKA